MQGRPGGAERRARCGVPGAGLAAIARAAGRGRRASGSDPGREGPLAAQRHRLVVCSSCASPHGGATAEAPGARLLAGLRAAADWRAEGFELGEAACMGGCATPLAVAFQASGKASYLFAGLDPEADLADVLAFARLYRASRDGWIEDARPAGRLRFCLRARIPALPER